MSGRIDGRAGILCQEPKRMERNLVRYNVAREGS